MYLYSSEFSSCKIRKHFMNSYANKHIRIKESLSSKATNAELIQAINKKLEEECTKYIDSQVVTYCNKLMNRQSEYVSSIIPVDQQSIIFCDEVASCCLTIFNYLDTIYYIFENDEELKENITIQSLVNNELIFTHLTKIIDAYFIRRTLSEQELDELTKKKSDMYQFSIQEYLS